MRYQPLSFGQEAGRGAAGALAAPFLLARDRALGLRRTALHAGASGHRRVARARGRRARAGAGLRDAAARRRCRSRPTRTPSWSLPASRSSYRLPPEAGAVDLAEDATAQLRLAPPEGLGYVAEGIDRNPSARTLRALAAGVSRRHRGRRPDVRGRACCRPSARLTARATSRCSSSRTAATRRGMRGGSPTRGRERSRAARPLPTRRSWHWRPGCAPRAPTTSTRACPIAPMRSHSGLPAARPGTARCSPPRWPHSCGSPACRRASPRDSPRAISAAASTT